MYKIKYELFGREAETVAFTAGEGQLLEITFTEEYEGLLSIDGVVARVANGVCRFDTGFIDEGEYIPLLVVDNDMIKLPGIKKTAKRILLSACGDDYVRKASLRERRLARRVDELEKKLESISAKLNDTTIF